MRPRLIGLATRRCVFTLPVCALHILPSSDSLGISVSCVLSLSSMNQQSLVGAPFLSNHRLVALLERVRTVLSRLATSCSRIGDSCGILSENSLHALRLQPVFGSNSFGSNCSIEDNNALPQAICSLVGCVFAVWREAFSDTSRRPRCITAL